MKKHIVGLMLASGFVISVVSVSCKKNPEITPEFTLNVKQDVFANNYNTSFTTKTGKDLGVSVNSNMAAVGRLLFYDPRLSVSGKTACGSCHKQSNGFADVGRFSSGFLNGKTSRNSMSIVNAFENPANSKHSPSFFWDGRASSLTELALMPAKNHLEMGMQDGSTITTAISAINIYKDAFQKVGMPINEENISACIAEFMKSIQGYSSKFDQGASMASNYGVTPEQMGKYDFSNFTSAENEGKKLFYEKYNCVVCHGFNSQMPMGVEKVFVYGGDSTTANSPVAMNIGLDGDVSSDPATKFKPPTLRNIAYSAPYMHDGRFKTLDDVVNHYSSGIITNSFLAKELRQNGFGSARQFNISDDERAKLIAFLKTMGEEQLLTDKRFSNPFKN